MACISCGVITSEWLCRISSRWVSAILRCTNGPVFAYPVYGPLYTRLIWGSLTVLDKVQASRAAATQGPLGELSENQSISITCRVLREAAAPTCGTLRPDSGGAPRGR